MVVVAGRLPPAPARMSAPRGARAGLVRRAARGRVVRHWRHVRARRRAALVRLHIASRTAGADARLSGWVHRRRDHGQLIFLDVRDRHGITQVVVDRTDQPEAHATASRLRSEYVVTVEGEVAPRLPGTENPRLPTGAIELRAREVDHRAKNLLALVQATVQLTHADTVR